MMETIVFSTEREYEVEVTTKTIVFVVTSDPDMVAKLAAERALEIPSDSTDCEILDSWEV